MNAVASTLAAISSWTQGSGGWQTISSNPKTASLFGSGAIFVLFFVRGKEQYATSLNGDSAKSSDGYRTSVQLMGDAASITNAAAINLQNRSSLGIRE